ncbi:hypothetical protein LZ683_08880 [Comamonas testosteroni]|uniref:hypothetical protein n=1 Tax=Comamonas testosteroni TaxID=285 RepID=UPI0023AB5163|nr:hypothetical protein [Comamonas testosteroni]WEE79455.1 hypothetical protein LZ683_08880 [Comamonas testosteroni]
MTTFTAQSDQQVVDLHIIKAMTMALDELTAACIDESGAPKAPDKKALMKARAMLPSWCSTSLTRPKGG